MSLTRISRNLLLPLSHDADWSRKLCERLSSHIMCIGGINSVKASMVKSKK